MANEYLDTNQFLIPAGTKVDLKKYNPAYCEGFADKNEARKKLKHDIKTLADLQYRLYAENRQALLIIFQAMDAAGKDGAIKHVFSGINPQGCRVNSFKSPTSNELQHDYLWRHYCQLPAKGQIGIFNRSHYENVLITKVHPSFILDEQLPNIDHIKDIDDSFWENRYRQISDFERIITENGITVIKFFLHLSKEEQARRFLSRINNKEKNWKFSSADIEERQHWDAYQRAYEMAIGRTSTSYAPWYVVPADNKWYTRMVVGDIVTRTLEGMAPKIPSLSEVEKAKLKKAKKQLE